MFVRWLEESLKRSLNMRRVVILVGARQCGKTTTSKTIADQNYIYRTLDDQSLFSSAKNDPQAFVKSTGKTMIIDEVQKVPELITAIKKRVDEDTRYGQYLITGSVNIQTLPTVKESLAGRVRKIRLRALTQGEILGKKPCFLQRIKEANYIDNPDYDQETLSQLILKGGYPEAVGIGNDEERSFWYQDYLNTILEADLKNISNIRRHDTLKELVTIVAAYSSKYMDKSKITSSLGISIQTLNSYIAVLENIYIVDKLSPWLKTDYERVNKSHKYFITDTGLMGAVLQWKYKDLFDSTDKLGKVFETFVYNQIITQVSLDNHYELYHYRDREKKEIDFILQDQEDNIYGIEVKAGSSVNKEHFKHMQWFSDNLVKDKNFTGIVLYTGEHTIPFGKNLYAVPMNNLWD